MSGPIRRSIIQQYHTEVHHPGFALLHCLIAFKCSQLSSAVAQQRAAQRSVVRCRPVPCLALRRGAEQRRVVPCGDVRCRAVSVQCRALPCSAVLLCGAAPCCAVIRAALDLLFCTCQFSFDEVSSSSTKVHHTRFVRTTLLNHIKFFKLSSALAQQCVLCISTQEGLWFRTNPGLSQRELPKRPPDGRNCIYRLIPGM